MAGHMTGHELKIERVKKNLKQIELATRTGIPRERLSRFENGWLRLRPEELQRIRHVLDRLPQRGDVAASRPALAAHVTGDAQPAPLQKLPTKEPPR